MKINLGKLRCLVMDAEFTVYYRRRMVEGEVKDLLLIKSCTSPHTAWEIDAHNAGSLISALRAARHTLKAEGVLKK